MLKVSLTSEWPADEYGIYEWRLTDENGEFITDATVFRADTTVYAVTNYTKFSIAGGIVKGYTGAKPKGKIIIPDGITEIAKDAFYECRELTQVRFPKSLKKIENDDQATGYGGAFCGCNNLRRADFSACTELTEIGNSSFLYCGSLTEVTFPESLQTIGEEAFSECTRLKGTLNLPENLQTIGKKAFDGCWGLTEVKFPEKLQTISEKAFFDCRGLTEVKFPASLQTIDKLVFSGCKGLTKVDVFDFSLCTQQLTKIGDGAFLYCDKA